VSRIHDERDMFWCRDCGVVVRDAAVLATLTKMLDGALPVPVAGDAHGSAALSFALPGACARCGGGRVGFGTR
jgi:hypothetical protein